MLGTHMIRCKSATSLYYALLEYVVTAGEKISPRGMDTSEVRGMQVVLEDPLRCIVDIPVRKLNYHFMVAEWWWIAMGDNSVETIKHYCNEIEKFSDDGVTFYGAYGPRWRRQIANVVTNLKKDNSSRQAIVTIFRPDLYDNHTFETIATKDVPCTISMQYVIRNNKLETIVTMRSWDAYMGFPYDIFNFSRLAAMVAGELGVVLGELMVQAGSLHLYARNFEKVDEVLAHRPTSSSISLEPLPYIPIIDSMRMWENVARKHGTVFFNYQPWSKYVKVLADRTRQQNDLEEPFRTLLAQRRLQV